MDALVLGGTRFIGLQLVRLLHSQGRSVTVLNRGQTQAQLPAGVGSIVADRSKPAQVTAALRGRQFDAAFDISGYKPSELQPVIAALDGNVGNYVFCSTAGGIFKKCVNSQAVYPLSEQHGLEAQERR